MNINSLLTLSRRLKDYALGHKVFSSIVLICLLGGGYVVYQKTHPANNTRYVLTTAQKQTIIASVTGSGQVSPTNQVDIKPRASGDVISVPVTEGQYVTAGTAIAYLDARDAQKAVRDAENSLASAKLSLQKLQEPADELSLTQAENNLAQAQDSKSNAQDDLSKAYDDGFTQVSNTFLDLPTVMTGLNSILLNSDKSLGASQWNIDYYRDAIAQYSDTVKAQQYRDDAFDKYNAAKAAYDTVAAEYKLATRNDSTDSIEKLIQDTNDMTLAVSASIKSATNLIQLYQDSATARNLTPVAISNTHLTSLSSYTSTTNGHVTGLSNSVSSIKSAKQSIDSATRSIAQNQASLDKTKSGADPLDLQSAQLNVDQRASALTDAQNTLSDYVVRAPFDGTLAKVDIKKADSASAGTVAATIITKQQIAELSLNELDAAKVKAGQRATLTFDAIDGLSITGEVASVDALGTVSQGVVSYSVKIGFDTQDPRVKPGMTVNATIQIDVHADVLSVPTSAVKTLNGASYVQVFTPPLSDTSPTGVGTTQTPVNVPVQVGLTDDTNTEITSGLTDGEQVISRTLTGTAAASTAARTTTTTGNRAGGFGGGSAIRLP